MSLESGNRNESYKDPQEAALRISKFLQYGVGHSPASSPEEHAPGIAEKISAMSIGGEEVYDSPDGKQVNITRTATGYVLSDFKS